MLTFLKHISPVPLKEHHKEVMIVAVVIHVLVMGVFAGGHAVFDNVWGQLIHGPQVDLKTIANTTITAVEPGDYFVHEFVVTLASSEQGSFLASDNWHVSVTVPENVQFVDDTHGVTCHKDNNLLQCMGPKHSALTSNDAIAFALRFAVPSSADCGTSHVIKTAAESHHFIDSAPHDNTAVTAVTINYNT